MSGILNNLKGYEYLYNVVSGIDKKLFREYNIPYCTYESNTVFLVILSDDITSDMNRDWTNAKLHCLTNGVELDFVIITEDEYKNWVYAGLPYIRDVEQYSNTTTLKLLESGYLSLNGK